jgi:CO/xanthine dehydrogenase Mo-binding subunit
MKEYSVIGKPMRRVDAVEKACGKTSYMDDLVLPGMLHGKVLRSRYAHAKVVDINTSKAERLPGVRAVITSRNTKMVKFGVSPADPQDEYVLAVDKVRYIGDSVAAVAAVDEDTAEEALELIDVEYEELPVVLHPEEAMKPGAPILHDECEDNIPYRVAREFGDVERGFAESDYVREDRLETPMVTPAFLEPQGAVANYDPITGKMTLYMGVQFLWHGRPVIARILGIPEEKLRLIRPYMGGGFGSKSVATFDPTLQAAFLSMRTGKPVKIYRSRDEEFLTTRAREPLVAYFKTGVKRDGTLVAMDCKHIANSGAYFYISGINCRQDSGLLDILFRCPNVRYDAYVLYTNTIPTGTFRGLTNNAFTYTQNCHLDMLAEDLGMDVVDFYLKNARQKGDITTADYRLDSCGLTECIEEVVKASGWKEKRSKFPTNRGIGFGLAAHTCGSTSGGSDLSTTVVSVDLIGKVKVQSGRGEAGQGNSTMVAMCVAEELGLPLEIIELNEFTDTDTTPFDRGNYGSRGTVQQGNASVAAARDVKRQLFQVIADKLEANPEDLEAEDSRIFVKGSPDRGMSFREAVMAYQASGSSLPLIGRGHYDPPTTALDPRTGIGNLSIAYGFGARVAEVEIDPETGQVKVLSLIQASDLGKAINPQILEGSAEGGISQSVGMALFEGIQYDEKGNVINASYSDYRMPTPLQTPKEIKHIWVETIDPHGPYGAKGIAEVTALGISPAIANAIYDAIGVRFYELPITPEKILNALAKKGDKNEV